MTTINFHFEGGMISDDNMADFMSKMTSLVQNGQARLGASHTMLGGALVATG